MKITIATGPIFPVPAVRGGAVQRLWEGLAREFAKRGHEVTIFAREFAGQPNEETVNGIRYVRRGGYEQSTSIKRDLLQCLLYALRTARHVPPGDVVVTNDFWMPVVLPWLNPGAGKVVPCLQRFPKKQCGLYGKCAALVAVSQAVADAVEAQSPSVADKIVVVPNAIDEVFLEGAKGLKVEGTTGLQDYKTTGQAAGDEGKLKDQEPQFAEADGDSARPGEAGGGQTQGLQDYGTTGQEGGVGEQTTDGRRPARILYVGRIHPEKGLALLADALKRIRQTAYGARHEAEGERQAADGRRRETEWECVLVGPVKQSEGGGGEAFAEELKQQVKGLPVRFEAPVYDPAPLAKIYDRADVFVYPSAAVTGEAMPLAPLEAMARGLVPVVSDLKVFREYLESDVNGVVFDHRGHEKETNLAIALGELVADPKKRERMGAAARKTAEKFSTAVIADKYLQLFTKVISGR